MGKLLKLLIVGLLPALPAAADPVPTTWTGFMHAGPADRAAIIDEVDAGTLVEVQGCEAGWCRVVANRAIGYLPQMLLALPPATPAPPPPGEQSCFPSEQFTRHGSGPVFYCPRR